MSDSGAGIAWRLEQYASLGSTSDLVRDRARAGERAGLAVLALQQTSGRGTHGRSWVAPEGNLNLSVLLRPRAGAAGLWALACGAALHQAVYGLVSDSRRLVLKWPNDLLLDGRKMAGILVEAEAGPGGVPAWLCVGIGVNLRAAPALADRPTACLAEAALPPGPAEMAARVVGSLSHWSSVLEDQGFAPVREAWLRAGCAVGSRMSIRRGGTITEGWFEGLTEDGALLLRTGAGITRHHSGEVLAEVG